MKKTNNSSYNRIVEYLKNDQYVDDGEKRFLINYATQLYKNNIENVEIESIEDVYESLKKYGETLKYMEDTSFTRMRINDVINILQEISVSKIDDELIKDVSYKIDKLYIQSDLPIRKNSSLSYNLKKVVGRKK